MTFGKSKPWNETLYNMTGRYDISTDSIKKYFQPLESWLLKKNSKTLIGWIGNGQSSSSKANPKNAANFQDHELSSPFGQKLNSGRSKTIRDSLTSEINNEKEDEEGEYALLSLLLDLFGEES